MICFLHLMHASIELSETKAFIWCAKPITNRRHEGLDLFPVSVQRKKKIIIIIRDLCLLLLVVFSSDEQCAFLETTTFLVVKHRSAHFTLIYSRRNGGNNPWCYCQASVLREREREALTFCVIILEIPWLLPAYRCGVESAGKNWKIKDTREPWKRGHKSRREVFRKRNKRGNGERKVMNTRERVAQRMKMIVMREKRREKRKTVDSTHETECLHCLPLRCWSRYFHQR